MKTKYRIVRDGYLGFECQIKRWYSPFWFQMHSIIGCSNTFSSIEQAEKFIERHKNEKAVVKYIS